MTPPHELDSHIQVSQRFKKTFHFHQMPPVFSQKLILAPLRPAGCSANHALQRTAPRVTVAASSLRLSPAAQRSRQPRGSLSLGSLGDSAPLS